MLFIQHCAVGSWSKPKMGQNCWHLCGSQKEKQKCRSITTKCAETQRIQIKIDSVPTKSQQTQGWRCICKY